MSSPKLEPTDVKTASSKRIALDVGLLVADMETSLQFYRDVLGLSVAAEARTSLIGEGRMVQLEHGASLIKLVQLDELPRERPTDIGASLGYLYMTLLVADISDIVAKLEKHGVTLKLPLTQLGNGAVIAMVEDPDGNVLEFVQEPS